MKMSRIAGLSVLLLLLPCFEAVSGPQRSSGVVIEAVTPESLGARAGLQAGDLLLSWCRAAASPRFPAPCIAEGTFKSPFDFAAMELEHAPRGGVKVFGKHAGRRTTWALFPGPQSVEVRPSDPQSRSLWSLAHEADTLARAQKWQEADTLYGQALFRARSLHQEAIEAQILKAWGKTFEDRSAWEKAEDLYRQSLDLDRAAGRDLAAAWSLDRLGASITRHSNLPEAETLLRQALEIHEALAPRSTSLAVTLRDLGNVVARRGDTVSATLYLGRALSILEDLTPWSFETAGTLLDMGDMGEVNHAEESLRRAKAIFERRQSESPEMATALYKLGVLAAYRDDRETTDYFLRRALAIQERLDASGAGTARTLEALGLQAYARQDIARAEEYLHRAIALNEKVAPDGLAVAHNLQNLGVVVLYRRDCAAAEKHFQRALEIRQRLNPGSADVAASLRTLGFLGWKCGDLPKAEAGYRQAVALYEALAPGENEHTMTVHDLGWAYRQMGRTQLAAEFLCRATSLFEARLEKSGRPERILEEYFIHCLSAQVDAGRETEAFATLERGRARIFFWQLAERDLVFSADLPEATLRRRKQLAQEIESAQAALARLSPARDASEAERLLERLRQARDQQRELTLQIRESSPRLESLRHPEFLDLDGARRALDPGTVLLSYAVSDDKSYLFVIQPADVPGPGLAVFPLQIGGKALGEAVESFRNLLQRRDSDRSQLITQASGLYDMLIGPAEARIATAQRLLVSADGPLLSLPFAALVRKGQFLVEQKPVHSVLSATVYAELQKRRRPFADPADSRLVAFGDPVYRPMPQNQDAAHEGVREVLAAVRNGLSLDPIPATRSEVESIAALFPGSRAYVGGEATEERVKAVGSQARLLHFACHGLFNERFSLDSALALTMPENPADGRDNGLLQAWEILESVRLDADLVTLSACDTALGQEVGGEGFIGLTRAFQIAGARSVLASLWSVSDVATGTLMKDFYTHLRTGMAKDEALQAAQVGLIRSPELSHPFYWAAFELVGDRR